MLKGIGNAVKNWIYDRKLKFRLRYRGGEYFRQQVTDGIWMNIITGLGTGAGLR